MVGLELRQVNEWGRWLRSARSFDDRSPFHSLSRSLFHQLQSGSEEDRGKQKDCCCWQHSYRLSNAIVLHAIGPVVTRTGKRQRRFSGFAFRSKSRDWVEQRPGTARYSHRSKRQKEGIAVQTLRLVGYILQITLVGQWHSHRNNR